MPTCFGSRSRRRSRAPTRPLSTQPAPKNTPVEVIHALNKEINAGLADPKFRTRRADLGSTVLPDSPGDFAKMIADETEKWAKVVKFAGIKPE